MNGIYTYAVRCAIIITERERHTDPTNHRNQPQLSHAHAHTRRLVAPADRDLYFLTYMRAFFTHTPPLTCFFKVRSCPPAVHLCVIGCV